MHQMKAWLNCIKAAFTVPKLGAYALSLLTLAATLPVVAGCNQQKATQVAQTIVNWQPAVDSAVQTTLGILETLTPDPAVAAIEKLVANGGQAFGVAIRNAAQAYIANPSSSTLTSLQTIIASFQQSVSQSLLQAVKIVDPVSQQKVLNGVNGIATIATTLLALVQSISSSAQLKAMSTIAAPGFDAPVKYNQVAALMDLNALREAGRPYNITPDHFFQLEEINGF
jgi:hypothetical protein